jgi:hypothetical protein
MLTGENMKQSMVNHPAHYNAGRIEVIEYLEDQFMNRPHEWNAVKYLSRANKKNPDKEIEDLEKAIWYIKRKIELLKAVKEGRSLIRPNDMNERASLINGEIKFPRNNGTMIMTGKWFSTKHVDASALFMPDDEHQQGFDLVGKEGCILFTPKS